MVAWALRDKETGEFIGDDSGPNYVPVLLFATREEARLNKLVSDTVVKVKVCESE